MESKWKAYFAGLKKGEKLPAKRQLLILLLAGILLMVIIIPVPDGKEEEKETENKNSRTVENISGYEAYLEEKTARILQYVEGTGKVKVMITLRSGTQKIIEKDQQSSSRSTVEEDSQGGARTSEDISSDKTSIYEQHSDGSQSPYVSREILPEIEGVVVIADGGDNAVVVRNITEAVQALFGVEAHKIKIMKRADT